MITIRFNDSRRAPAIGSAPATAPYFPEDMPLGRDEHELDPDYVAALTADSAIYSGAGCESHLWIG